MPLIMVTVLQFEEELCQRKGAKNGGARKNKLQVGVLVRGLRRVKPIC